MRTFLIFAVIVGASIFALQRKQISQLRTNINEARARSVVSPPTVTEETAKTEDDEIAKLRSDRLELMRLRSEMPALREQAKATGTNFQDVLARTRAEAARQLERAAELQAAEDSRTRSKQMEQLFGMVLNVALEAAKANNGRMPTTRQELEAFAEKRFGPGGAEWGKSLDRFREPFGITFDSIELLPVTIEYVTPNPGQPQFRSAKDHELVVARERISRLLPDGRSSQWVGFALGYAKEIILPANTSLGQNTNATQ